jgi:hypothetical protein
MFNSPWSFDREFRRIRLRKEGEIRALSERYAAVTFVGDRVDAIAPDDDGSRQRRAQ